MERTNREMKRFDARHMKATRAEKNDQESDSSKYGRKSSHKEEPFYWGTDARYFIIPPATPPSIHQEAWSALLTTHLKRHVRTALYAPQILDAILEHFPTARMFVGLERGVSRRFKNPEAVAARLSETLRKGGIGAMGKQELASVIDSVRADVLKDKAMLSGYSSRGQHVVSGDPSLTQFTLHALMKPSSLPLTTMVSETKALAAHLASGNLLGTVRTGLSSGVSRVVPFVPLSQLQSLRVEDLSSSHVVRAGVREQLDRLAHARVADAACLGKFHLDWLMLRLLSLKMQGKSVPLRSLLSVVIPVEDHAQLCDDVIGKDKWALATRPEASPVYKALHCGEEGEGLDKGVAAELVEVGPSCSPATWSRLGSITVDFSMIDEIVEFPPRRFNRGLPFDVRATRTLFVVPFDDHHRGNIDCALFIPKAHNGGLHVVCLNLRGTTAMNTDASLQDSIVNMRAFALNAARDHRVHIIRHAAGLTNPHHKFSPTKVASLEKHALDKATQFARKHWATTYCKVAFMGALSMSDGLDVSATKDLPEGVFYMNAVSLLANYGPAFTKSAEFMVGVERLRRSE